jgi:glycosyltransferase involved in cell wall biosynthesis
MFVAPRTAALEMTSAETRPLVSVLIASYNRAELLCASIRSALDQGGEELEVVVSDDASPDDSAQRASAIGDHRVRVTRQPVNVGVWQNFASTLAQARGEFVVFLGDDDFLSPGFVAAHLAVFRRHPALSAVFCPLEDRPADGSPSLFLTPGLPCGTPSPSLTVVDQMLVGTLYCGSAMFRTEVARTLWAKARPYELAADWALMIGLGLSPDSTVSACQGCKYIKRIHPVRLSSRYLEVTESLIKVCEEMADSCSDTTLRRRLGERAVLERITLARHYAAKDDLPRCRQLLTYSMLRGPGSWGLTSQFLQSYLLGPRLIRTAKSQRG